MALQPEAEDERGKPMTYCATCGTECANCATKGEEQAAIDREVEIARLNTKRDVEVARITAGQWKDETETMAKADVKIAEIEAETGVEAAEAVAEAVTEILAPDPPETAEPIVIEAAAEIDQAETIEPREESGSEPPKDTKSSWSYW
jgi:hypothetical protein